MAKINISFNNTTYSIDEASLSAAITQLKSHLSTVMNGTGATINLDGITYNIDSTKLSTATTDFIAHLGTIAGDGSKITVGGVEYSIDSNKMSDVVSDLETALDNMSKQEVEEEINFATSSWAKISEISQAGRASEYFNIGDTRKETLNYADGTSEEIELQIAAIGIDIEHSTKVPVMTLITKNLLSKTSQWATSSNYLQTNYHGSTLFRTYLTNTVFPALSEDLRSVAKRCVNMQTKSSLGDSSTYAYYIMPPDEFNMGYYYTTTPTVTDGWTYPIFTADNSSRIKTRNGVADIYPVYSNRNSIINYSVTKAKNAILANGSLYAEDTYRTDFGVCFLLFV